MAIDASVYTLQKPVPAVDPQDVLTGVLNTNTLIAKGQQQQQQMADDAETRRILQQYGGDKSNVVAHLRAKGLYAPADAIEKADIANRKARADALETALKNQSSVNTQLSGYVAAAKDGLTPENAPQRMAILRQQILSTPADPDDPPGTREQLASQLAQFDPVNTPKVLDQWANGLLDEQQQITNHQNTLKALFGTDPVKGAAEMLVATKDPKDYADEYQTILSTVRDPDAKRLIAQSFIDPSKLTTPEAFQAAIQRANDLSTTTKEKADIANSEAIRKQTADSEASLNAYRQSELGIRRAELGVTQAREAREEAAAGGGVTVPQNVDPNAPHGADFLKTLPETEQNMVKALAEGRQPWPSAFAIKTPYWQKLMGEVFQYDPTFDTATASNNARVKVRQDFTSGKSAQQVNAINTVAGHLATLADNASKLNNSNFQTVNWLKNLVKTETGSSDVTNFNTAKEAVASELTRVWRQAGGSEQDIKDWKSTIDATQSPEQLKGAFAQIGGLIESKLQALQDQYQQGMGIAKVSVISPEARAALDKLENGAKAASKAYTGEVRISKDGRILGMVNGQVVELLHSGSGYVVK